MGIFYKIFVFIFVFFATLNIVAQNTDSIPTSSTQAVIDSLKSIYLLDTIITSKKDTSIKNVNNNENSFTNSDSVSISKEEPDSLQNITPPTENIALVPPFLQYTDTLIVRFIKEYSTHSPDSLYFNVLKITNYKEVPIRAELMFSAPDKWNIISAFGNVVNLSPGDSAFIPIRLAMEKNVVGGYSYILNATVRTQDEFFSCNAYVTVPGQRNWKATVDKSIVVFNPYFESEDIKIKLSNKGNTTETIKLELKVGEMLLVDGIDEFSNVFYISLANNKDSIFKIRVKYNNSIPFEDKVFLEKNWKASSVEVTASTFDRKQKMDVWFKHLYSSYYGSKLGVNSPLNVGLNASNLLSGQVIRLNAEAFGTILLPQERRINYTFNLLGFGLEHNVLKSFNFKRKTNFLVSYFQDKLSVHAGSNISTATDFGMGFSGYGVKADYKFDKNTRLSAGVMNSRNYSDAFGGYAKFTKKVYIFNLRTGIGYSSFPSLNKNYLSGAFGFSVAFLKYHSFGADVYRAAPVSLFLENDSTSKGIGYSLLYAFHYKKFNFTANFKNQIRYSKKVGEFFTFKSVYVFNKNIKLDGSYDRRKSFSDISKYGLTNNFLNNVSDIAKLILYINPGNSVSYSLGPLFTTFIQQGLRENTYISTTSTYNPRFNMLANRRIDKRTSISAYFTFGLAYVNYKTDEPLIRPINLKNKGTYSFGSTFNSKYWRVTAAYNIGSVTDMWSYLNYHMMFPGLDISTIKMTQSLIIRPLYERTFLENRIRTQFMANYTFYIPTKRENITLSSNNYFSFKNGWSASFIANMYIGSIEDAELGRMSNKSLNLQVGFRKAFDIQQPRLKHYDLTIVCFNDLNANKIKDENEPPLPNIQISYERTSRSDNPDGESIYKPTFSLIELITSPDGETFYSNIPQGNYKVKFTPLFDLKDLYNINGEEQIITIVDGNTTVLVPYAEAYKIKGNVVISRDEFSSEGLIYSEGIRITATNITGESYSVLTDKNGEYVLSVPQAQTYSVKVNNVFNDQFICEKDQYEIHFNGIKVIKIDFKFVEKKRKINFNTNIDQFYIFQSLSSTQVPNQQDGIKSFKTEIDTANVLNYIDAIMDSKAFANPDKVNREKQIIPVTTVSENGLIFKVQLFNADTKKRTYGEVKSFPQVICIDGENGNLKYLSGSYTDFKKAKEFVEELKQFGLNDAQVIPFKDKKQISLQEAGVE